jgi:hypothetical protein
MTTPIHRALTPADPGYDEVEVDPWPHVHIRENDDGTVTVGLIRWKGQHSYDRDSRRELEAWQIEVRPPGAIWRALGVTFAQRIDAAAEKLIERWEHYLAMRDAAFVAASRHDHREPPR